MTVIQKLSSFWKNAWSLDTRSLAIFRIFIGIIACVDVAFRSQYLIVHYTNLGMNAKDMYHLSYEQLPAWSLHGISGDIWFQTILFLLHGYIAVMLILGYKTRLMSIGLWILTVSLHNVSSIINSGADDLLRMVLFWSMFLPLNRHVSYDSGKEDHTHWTRYISIASVAFITQQILLYWVTAYLKKWPEWYSTWSATYEILSLETFRLWESPLYHSQELMQVITYLSIGVEVISPLLLILPFRRMKMAGIATIILLHIGIMTHIGVWIFPWVSIATMIALIPWTIWDAIEKFFHPKKGTIYFDDRCSLCTTWITWIRWWGMIKNISYIPLREASQKIQALAEKENMWIMDRGKEKMLWFSGVRECMKNSWYGRIFVPLTKTRIGTKMGEKMYRYISKKRTCRITPPVPQRTPKKYHAILMSLCAWISLYVVIITNISVMTCHHAWAWFFRVWPLGAISVLHEWKINTVLDLKASKFRACSKVFGDHYTFIEKNTFAKNLFRWHSSFLWSWLYFFRLDQYWWMFAPDPVNTDFWFIVDGAYKWDNHILHKNLWKELSGYTKNIPSERPENLHEYSHGDRWRKFTSNITKKYNSMPYLQWFSHYWCQKYHALIPWYTLDHITIYTLSQASYKDYKRGEIEKKQLITACCSETCINS